MNKVNIEDIENNIGFKITNQELINYIEFSNLLYENLQDQENESYIL